MKIEEIVIAAVISATEQASKWKGSQRKKKKTLKNIFEAS